jgi:hypothetical protein
MYPSILRQLEIKVLMNIFFRTGVCVPMSAHCFIALVARNNMKEVSIQHSLFSLFNNIACLARIIEVLSLGLISIIHIRIDYPGMSSLKVLMTTFLEAYRILFTLFILCAMISMYVFCVLLLMLKRIEVSKLSDLTGWMHNSRNAL